MFGRQGLKNQIEHYKSAYETYADKYLKEREAREAQSLELFKALESVQELDRERAISQALADENRDLLRQVELLQSVLKQVSISIKLPARKK